MTFAKKKKMLSPIQLVTDEKVESFVLPITGSNCHVMKLMFCRIYNLLLMVFLLHPLLPDLIFAQLFHNKRNRTICEGSLILFSFDFFPSLLFSLPPGGETRATPSGLSVNSGSRNGESYSLRAAASPHKSSPFNFS